MAKLTLSVDEDVVNRAKRYAKDRGVSVSKVVEDYLSAVGEPTKPRKTPILDSLRGVLQGSKLGIDDYRKHLTAKHR